MKVSLSSRAGAGESAIRPGFDVLMAVTGARQAASPTARCVAANRSIVADADSADQRRALLAGGRGPSGAAARFADVAPAPAAAGLGGDEPATQMNGLFTRAFQPMVKLGDVNPQDKTGGLHGPGPGME